MCVNIDETTLEKFKTKSATTESFKKGYMGKCVQEALDMWMSVGISHRVYKEKLTEIGLKKHKEFMISPDNALGIAFRQAMDEYIKKHEHLLSA